VAAKVLSEAGFDVTTATVDVSSRASVRALVEMATLLGEVQGVIHAAGVTRMKTATVRRLASPQPRGLEALGKRRIQSFSLMRRGTQDRGNHRGSQGKGHHQDTKFQEGPACETKPLFAQSDQP
jgi:hypothetical protein